MERSQNKQRKSAVEGGQTAKLIREEEGEKLRSLKGFLPESKSFKNTIDFLSSKKTRTDTKLVSGPWQY